MRLDGPVCPEAKIRKFIQGATQGTGVCTREPKRPQRGPISKDREAMNPGLCKSACRENAWIWFEVFLQPMFSFGVFWHARANHIFLRRGAYEIAIPVMVCWSKGISPGRPAFRQTIFSPESEPPDLKQRHPLKETTTQDDICPAVAAKWHKHGCTAWADEVVVARVGLQKGRSLQGNLPSHV